ncbi:MAG TPA: hypothetical protein VKE94_03165 [Gemmataceae bacterium]|nr:hypothetical protein [Gemmataceae bacterium]
MQSLACRLEKPDKHAQQFTLPDVVSAITALALTLFASGPIT